MCDSVQSDVFGWFVDCVEFRQETNYKRHSEDLQNEFARLELFRWKIVIKQRSDAGAREAEGVIA